MRLGGTLERVVDVRVVSATHRNLEEQSTAPRFRSDLYYRLSATTLLVPPLRDRPLDICLLARAFLQHACDDLGKPPIALSSAALRRLTLHNWPGNVRELKNVMRYLAAAVSGTEALACQLPDRVAATAAPWMVAEGSAAARRQTAEDRPACEGVFRNIHEEIEELERTRIRQALEHTGGVRVKAAQLIGMPLRTMLTKMKQYGLEAIAVSEGKPRS
jgi:DNA-binding NtrC family response regulator